MVGLLAKVVPAQEREREVFLFLLFRFPEQEPEVEGKGGVGRGCLLIRNGGWRTGGWVERMEKSVEGAFWKGKCG